MVFGRTKDEHTGIFWEEERRVGYIIVRRHWFMVEGLRVCVADVDEPR
jgi:hypothetical protein